MKYSTFAIVALILNGCEKCAICTTTTTTDYYKSSYSYDACGDELDYALNNNRTITNYTSSGRVITNIRTTCK